MSNNNCPRCEKSYTRVEIDIQRSQYFLIMEACLILRDTMDEFILDAISNYLESMYLQPPNTGGIHDHESFPEDHFSGSPDV